MLRIWQAINENNTRGKKNFWKKKRKEKKVREKEMKM